MPKGELWDSQRAAQWIEWGERHDSGRESCVERYNAFCTNPANTAADLEQIDMDIDRTYPEVGLTRTLTLLLILTLTLTLTEHSILRGMVVHVIML